MNQFKSKIILCLFSIGTTASSLAHNDPRYLDKDNDGLISRNEFRLIDERQMSRSDLNRDGQVSKEEILLSQKREDLRDEKRKAKRREMMQQRFSDMDVNGDDIVTEEEAKDHAFSTLDKNRDGYVSLTEMRKQKGSRKYRKDYQEKKGKEGVRTYK